MTQENNRIGYRLFIGDIPYESLSPEEQSVFASNCTKRMGDALGGHFVHNSKEYAAVCHEIGGKN